MTVINDGPLLTGTNYWDMPHAARGLCYLTANAGDLPGGTWTLIGANIMSQKHSYEEIANDFSLWVEFVDASAAMTRDEFDAMPVDQKINIQIDAFGPEKYEMWEAWEDGKHSKRVQFKVPYESLEPFDVAEAGARALGVDVSERLNVARV